MISLILAMVAVFGWTAAQDRRNPDVGMKNRIWSTARNWTSRRQAGKETCRTQT